MSGIFLPALVAIIARVQRVARYGVVVFLVAAPALADSRYDLPTDPLADQSLEEFVLGNLEFILMHELAHLVVSEKQIPVIGPEEGAADYIAATFLIRGDGQDASVRPRLRRYVASAASAFAVLWQHERNMGTRIPYWTNHALGIQRYFRLMCLLAGSGDAAATDALAKVDSLLGQLEDCKVEFAKADRAVQWMLDEYGRGPGEPAGEAVNIVYQETRTQLQEKLMGEVRNRRLGEQTVAALTDRFTLGPATNGGYAGLPPAGGNLGSGAGRARAVLRLARCVLPDLQDRATDKIKRCGDD